MTFFLNKEIQILHFRLKSGNPGYLVVSNIGKEAATVDLRQLHSVPDELTLIARTENLHESLSFK